MDNETTMPGLLTMPGALNERAKRNPDRFFLYKLIFAAAVLVLVLSFWLL
ncbi:hypothetical protein [Curvibacter sp. PAE-UM]|nr:hypothetical protein [Curvibacter sp. PAE-UM]